MQKRLTNWFTGYIVSYMSNEPYNERSKRKKQARKEAAWLNEILTQEKSIYLQIKEMMEQDILRDILLEDERVPSTNELAKRFTINPATAAKGVNLLVEEGILYKKRGIGMFVAKGAKAQIVQKRKESFYDRYVRSLIVEAKGLGITKAELIEMIAGAKEGED